MSTETAVQEKKREPLFSKKNKKLISDPMDDANPVTVQVLGICSALAITVKLENALVMTASVLAVMIFGSLTISLIRNMIPSRIRIIVQLVVVAALVIIVDQVLRAFVFEVSQQVGVYVGLIITNCIIMGRFEAFAMGNKAWPSVLDAFGNAIAYGVILVIVAFFRELFGSGTLMGFRIIPESIYASEGGFYFDNNMMILPPMALVIVGIIIWVQRARNESLIEEN